MASYRLHIAFKEPFRKALQVNVLELTEPTVGCLKSFLAPRLKSSRFRLRLFQALELKNSELLEGPMEMQLMVTWIEALNGDT